VVAATEKPALTADDDDGALLRVLTYSLSGDGCEVLTLHAAERGRGIGTALLAGCRSDFGIKGAAGFG
jgi:hypothetical protein